MTPLLQHPRDSVHRHYVAVAVAALVISILAVLLAAVSVFFAKVQADATRKQADAAKEQADAATRMVRHDAERRREERTPSFAGEIEQVSGGWYRLWLRLTSSMEELSAVRVEILDENGVAFTEDQMGVGPAEPSPVLRARVADADGRTRLAPGDRHAWQVRLPSPRPPQVSLRVTATAGETTWTVPVSVDVPTDVATQVW
jgi:hypothetical protein